MFGFLAKMSLRRVIPVVIAIIAISATAITALSSYLIASKALTEEASAKLHALADARASEMTDYLEFIREDIVIQSDNPAIRQALKLFGFAWEELGANPEGKLQDLYINKNSFPTGEKDKLMAAKDGSTYSDIHGNITRGCASFWSSAAITTSSCSTPKATLFTRSSRSSITPPTL